MTPNRPLHRDIRVDVRGLAQRAQIDLPPVLAADGTVAGQTAIIATGTDLALASLPHRELNDDPRAGRGAALVGTREPDMRAWVPQLAVDGVSPDAAEPSTLAWLLTITGFRNAPSALWKLAGWQIGWVAAFLDRLRDGGAEAQLIIAERQAAAAVRQMWLVRDASTGTSVASSGAVLVGRALIDLVAAVAHVGEDAIAASRLGAGDRDKMRDALTLMIGALDRYVRAAEQAAAAPTAAAPRLSAAIKIARTIADAIALFSVASEPVGQRIARLRTSLTKRLGAAPVRRSDIAELEAIDERLSKLVDGSRPNWPEHHVSSLDRLAFTDRAKREARLAAVRTDLIHQLLIARRVDKVHAVLPWMTALSGAFLRIYGGPTGALCQLYEAARALEIARELVRRVHDAGSAQRLDTHQGKAVYAAHGSMHASVAGRARAGFLLAESALSHAMAKAWLGGAPFDARHPISTAAAGELYWSLRGSLTDPTTAATISAAELAKPIYTSPSYETDLPRYMGLAVVPLLGFAVTQIFRGVGRGAAFGAQVAEVAAFDKHVLKRVAAPGMCASVGVATRELMRSMLRSLDIADDTDVDEWRSDDEVVASARTLELHRADDRLNRHTPVGKEQDGGAIRRAASKHDEAAGSPGDELWAMIDRATSWTPRKPGDVRSEDGALEAVLAGTRSPPGHAPLSPWFIPVLWLKPDIDARLLRWIGGGASPGLQPSGRQQAVATVIDAVHAKAPALYLAANRVNDRQLRILVPLFTGLSAITADHAHVRR